MVLLFPLAVLATSLFWDIAYAITGHPVWGRISFISIVAGLIVGLVAEIGAAVECRGLPREKRIRRLGREVRGFSLLAMAAFGVSAVLRVEARHYARPPVHAVLLSVAGFAVVLLVTWLIGRLVTTLGNDRSSPLPQ